MSSRLRLVALSLSLVTALACGRRDASRGGAGSGTAAAATGSGAGSQSAAAAQAAAQAAVDKAAAEAAAARRPAPKPDGTLQLVGIDVLTTPAVFQQRAVGAGPRPMEPLVAAAKAAVATIDAARPGVLGDSVVVWIAIRPGRKVKTWVACPGKPDADPARADVVARMALAIGPEVTGPVAFAITFDRSGARPRSGDISLPPELEAVRGAVGAAPTPEALIERAWKP